jgi:uncharacterized protein (DUF1015 family)
LQHVVPFRAWRYSAAAGDLSRLVAPPYDVIDASLQARLYATDPHNVVRVDLGVTTPSDSDQDNQYTRAAAQLADWKKSGVLVRDREPSMTFVEETFTGPDGRSRVRHGFLAALRLHQLDEGVVFAHEHTMSGPKEDRYQLMTSTAMSLSPVFLLYDLPGDEITSAWREAAAGKGPSATIGDEDGNSTKLWPTTDPDLLEAVGQSLAGSRFVIADGHHRYETALRYQKHHRSPASDYALAYLSNMSDSGLAIYGTHRLVAGLTPDVVSALPRSLSGTFVVDRLNSPADAGHVGAGAAPASGRAAAAQAVIARYLAEHPRWAFGLWGPGLDAAYGLRLADAAAAHAAAPGHSKAYQELDVSILQALVLEKALGISAADMAAERYVTFFKDPNDAFSRLSREEFQVGFFMNPTGLDQIRQVAVGGERMPQKATFFYPKLPTGLVLHDLSGEL